MIKIKTVSIKINFMKRIILFAAAIAAFALSAGADNRPSSFEQLPDGAKTFLNSSYKGVEVVSVTKEDDWFRPDYNVVLSNGIFLEFSYSGSLKKIEAKKGTIAPALIPEGIRKFVDRYYPGTGYVEYEVGRKDYEVTLSNRLELKFDNEFRLIEVDD